MATENKYFTTTLAAGEDLNTSAFRYHAIALDDGKLANNAEEASGILLNKPKSGEFLELGYGGEMMYAAGAGVTKGAKLTVTTSGWFTTAGSSSIVVGEAKVTVTSGSLGTGLFFFPQQTAAWPENLLTNQALKDTVIAGVAVDLKTLAPAADEHNADTISQEACSSGTATNLLLWGKGIGRVGITASLGDALASTTSGYLSAPTSGDFVIARALANIASGATGNIMFYGSEVGYKPTSWAA